MLDSASPSRRGDLDTCIVRPILAPLSWAVLDRRTDILAAAGKGGAIESPPPTGLGWPRSDNVLSLSRGSNPDLLRRVSPPARRNPKTDAREVLAGDRSRRYIDRIGRFYPVCDPRDFR